MAIIKRNNSGLITYTNLMSDLLNVDKFFQNDFLIPNWVPAVNVAETDEQYEIELSAPGYKKDDFEVDINNGILNISAKTKEEREEKGKDYTRREFSSSSFSRAFTLPENANQDDIDARYENGILKLSLAKKHAAESTRKEIKVS